METSRLEAFSDGVIAVIITIMVLELKTPHGDSFAALRDSIPTFTAYVLSFVYTAIYWNNHHHLMLATERIDGRSMWANMHLLFWLSLVPFTTAWVGENHGATAPLVIYGVVLLMAALAYSLLQNSIIARNGPGSLVGRAVGSDWKGKVSLALYLTAIGAAFFAPWLAELLFGIVAAVWFVPDRRIERVAVAEAEAAPPETAEPDPASPQAPSKR